MAELDENEVPGAEVVDEDELDADEIAELPGADEAMLAAEASLPEFVGPPSPFIEQASAEKKHEPGKSKPKLAPHDPSIRIRWHIDAFIDGRGTYAGFVKEISAKGTEIFIDLNLQLVKEIKLKIYVPPFSHSAMPVAMEVLAKVVRSAYDSDELNFRSSVRFTQFMRSSDQTFLQSRIRSNISYNEL